MSTLAAGAKTQRSFLQVRSILRTTQAMKTAKSTPDTAPAAKGSPVAAKAWLSKIKPKDGKGDHSTFGMKILGFNRCCYGGK